MRVKMEIYIVQMGDTIYSIAERFGLNVERLMFENNIRYPDQLVIGQALVIAYPKQSHIVQEGDTLQGIAETYNVSILQILRNNPFLSDRKDIYPGESLVISYNTTGSIITNGFTFPFIDRNTLIKTLPNLTYLSIFNYRFLENFDIFVFDDNDAELIRIAKEYEVVPLLLISILTLQGEPDINTAYRILLDENSQYLLIDRIVDIMKNKGYEGINIVINILNSNNQTLVKNFIQKISERFTQENLLLFMTINYDDDQVYDNIDYSQFSEYVDDLTFIQLNWGRNEEPPGPVSNINTIKAFIDQILEYLSPDEISIGKSIIGYDWQIPFVPQVTSIVAISPIAAIELAYESNSVIQFDDYSQTPFFAYFEYGLSFPSMHVVWFIDARSINALLEYIKETGIHGSGIWNIMVYNPQLWLLFNSQFDIVKIT
jgi:spore germination protein